VVKRLFDIVAASVALIVLSPVFLIAAIGIRLSGKGPVFYHAERAGKHGKPFIIHKFRTMQVTQGPNASAITSSQDARVFPFGRLLRICKIDELPQLINVLRGDMSVVGPRPEAMDIVRNNYAPQHMETLAVPPGLASPGSIYDYTHGVKLIGQENPEKDYLLKLLPIKLALEMVYVQNAGIVYDFRIILRTILVISLIALGKREFSDPPEMKKIERIVPARNLPA
jgi:lipopolysaccharide/colanic/teichoic acid biosynthesis glycosyltransferase